MPEICAPPSTPSSRRAPRPTAPSHHAIAVEQAVWRRVPGAPDPGRVPPDPAVPIPPDPPLYELGRNDAWSELPEGDAWDGPEEVPLRLVHGEALARFREQQSGALRTWLEALDADLGVAFGFGDLPWPWPLDPAVPESLPLEAQAREALLARGLPIWEDLAFEVTYADGFVRFFPDPLPNKPRGLAALVFVDLSGDVATPRHHAYAVADGRVMHWDPPPAPSWRARMVSWIRAQPEKLTSCVPGRCGRPQCDLCDAAELVAGMARAQP